MTTKTSVSLANTLSKILPFDQKYLFNFLYYIYFFCIKLKGGIYFAVSGKNWILENLIIRE